MISEQEINRKEEYIKSFIEKYEKLRESGTYKPNPSVDSRRKLGARKSTK